MTIPESMQQHLADTLPQDAPKRLQQQCSPPDDDETEGGDPDADDGPVLAADEPGRSRRRRGAVLQ